MTSKKALETKIKIIKAANQLLEEQETSKFTLEEVAKKAGVSKGGLLYHFSSKRELIQGMLIFFMEQEEQIIKKTMDNGINSWLEAYIKGCNISKNNKIPFSASIIAAINNDKTLLNPIRKKMRLWQKQIENSEIDPDVATIIRLAIDGLWFLELFEITPIDDKKRTKVMKLLEKATKTGKIESL